MRPACKVTRRSSVAASRVLCVTIRKPQPLRATRSRAKRQHLVGGVLVEIAGRLVGEQQQRLWRQRAADRDALLLPAGQLLRIAPREIAEPEPLHQFAVPGRIVPPGEARLEFQIVLDRQARDQIELLEHEAQLIAPQRRAAGIVESGERHPAEPDVAAVGRIQPRDQMQQRALAAAAFAGQRHALGGRDAQIHPAQHGDRLVRRAVALGEIFDFEHVYSGFWYFSTNSSTGIFG